MIERDSNRKREGETDKQTAPITLHNKYISMHALETETDNKERRKRTCMIRICTTQTTLLLKNVNYTKHLFVNLFVYLFVAGVYVQHKRRPVEDSIRGVVSSGSSRVDAEHSHSDGLLSGQCILFFF